MVKVYVKCNEIWTRDHKGRRITDSWGLRKLTTFRKEAFRMLHGDCAVINSQRLQTSSYSESSYLCCRVSASSGDAAEGMAPPRGRDCNFLKPSLVITWTKTGPLASSQPPQREPIDKHSTEWQTRGEPCPKNKLEVTDLGNWIVNTCRTQGHTHM